MDIKYIEFKQSKDTQEIMNAIEFFMDAFYKAMAIPEYTMRGRYGD